MTRPRARTPIKLTVGDWHVMWSAMTCFHHTAQEYRRILRKIGDRGAEAATRGVAAVKGRKG